ncbi:MAG: enoyl-CoA hydratase/isomerase family protein [Hyphomicrobiales bacterium]|nr:enoyl-CoA hydratase/isomerase family protein [Hyphomicrobiales bacterium]MBV9741504.1 enoyl-CoA hydratase/isomerase family protein [Hyphomicrobiales bacterium]
MQTREILYDVKDHVATITLNRPEKLNAWTHVMEQDVRRAMTEAAEDREVRVIVVTGAGRGFCAGADLDRMKASLESGKRGTLARHEAATEGLGEIEVNYQQRFSYLLRVPKPIIAAINGPVAGIGLCFVLFTDLRYIAPSAKVTTAFARRGLIAEHGMSFMLPRLIGLRPALDLLYSARVITGTEAAQLGLADLLPEEGFSLQVYEKARAIALNSSPRSTAVIKRQVYDDLFRNLAESWNAADAEMYASFESEDFKEGVAHYFEKRAPRFTGR